MPSGRLSVLWLPGWVVPRWGSVLRGRRLLPSEDDLVELAASKLEYALPCSNRIGVRARRSGSDLVRLGGRWLGSGLDSNAGLAEAGAWLRPGLVGTGASLRLRLARWDPGLGLRPWLAWLRPDLVGPGLGCDLAWWGPGLGCDVGWLDGDRGLAATGVSWDRRFTASRAIRMHQLGSAQPATGQDETGDIGSGGRCCL